MRPGSDLKLHLNRINGNGHRRLALALIAMAIAFSLCSCSQSKSPAVEAPVAYQPSPSPTLPDIPKLPAKPTEVQAVVQRIFKDAVVIDEGYEPNFISGDFNGDHSQDVAIVVRPAKGKLADLNVESPPWLLRDPFQPQSATSPLRINDDELLLAIIHGNGADDWRDPSASQTYLLKNAVGVGLKTEREQDFKTANAARKLPQLHGDLISQTLQRTSGYLYFTTSTYAWYDPKSFKGEPDRRLVHGGSAVKSDR